MARLSKTEQAQLKKAVAQRSPVPPPPQPMSPRAYIQFATFAARFDRSIKPVRFSGDQWKL